MGKRQLFLLIFIFSLLPAHAQVNIGEIFFVDIQKSEVCKKSFNTSDSLVLSKQINECLLKYHSQGFLEARIDSIHIDSLRIKAYAFKGNKYKWVLLNTDSTTQLYLEEAGLNPFRLTRKPLNPSSFVSTSQNILNHFEDMGYPFSRVSFSNSTIEGNTISSIIKVDRGPYIILDTLYLRGDAKISHKFLESYLGFSKGEPYREKQLKGFDSRIRKLGFLAVIRPSEVEYIPGRARIYTYLTNQRASQFSGLVGFTTRNDNSNRLQFTGDVNLRLVNVFRQGERNHIQWQALGEETQRLNLSSTWSYILGRRVGVSTQFRLFRRDTTYLNLNPKIALNFHMQNGSYFGLGFDNRTSRTLVQGSNLNNYSTSFYQVIYSSDIFPDEVFPMELYWVTSTAGIGTRKSAVFGQQSNQSRSTVGEAKVTFIGYYPLPISNFVIHFKFQGEVMKNISPSITQNQFMENELYRIGGMGNLRGFNQESILTDAYSILTGELQFRVQKSLNFFTFIDKGYVSQVNSSIRGEVWPMGVGFGFELLATGGILNISYATGRGFGEDFSLRTAKVHVGYKALF